MNKDSWINPKFIKTIDEFSGERIKDRRRRIFEQVALSAINKGADWDAKGFNPVVADCTEKIIKAADEFAEKEIEK